ncbi:hypothetical protein SynBIOSU31_01722 [Synechococcus sp. BIOS-U3-1]|uniref:hypothetical protein n=1 Tax=Synechococcus sp. BIOS-U3-1 TaxID=1400865 RepID=UPI00164911B0|nr:hypothetical protein [Synechococcus sp. BIOS-U3-1]QNI58591.1 hypothetical protein SynBIOSU31_01722 [Synechococcus sp. BIOS-U3-1]
MSLRERFADLLIRAACRIAPPVNPDEFDELPEVLKPLEKGDHLTVAASADAADLPSVEPLSLDQRVISRSVKTLKAEAISSLATLHAAHLVGASVWDERRIAARINAASGIKAASPEVLAEIEGLAVTWQNDLSAITNALQQVAAISCPEAPISQDLRLEGEEQDLAADLIESCSVELTRHQLELANPQDDDDEQELNDEQEPDPQV